MVQEEDIKKAAEENVGGVIEGTDYPQYSFVLGANYVIESLGWTGMDIEPKVTYKPIIVAYKGMDRLGKVHKYYDIYTRLNSGKFFRDVRDPQSYTWDEINKFADGQEPMWTFMEFLLP